MNLKKCITEDIKNCDIFCVLIGKDTHKSEWVDKYEIPKAFDFNKKIVGILINKSNKLPKSFKKYSDLLSNEFTLDKIMELIGMSPIYG